jgi:phospholipid/cholesterol/gamma-HCH transport system substrate-binding protein
VGYGDQLPGRTAEGLAGDTEELARKADLALTRINELLSPQLIQNVHGSTAELRQLVVQLSATVDEQRRSLNTLTASLQRSAAGFEKVATAPELEASIKRLDRATQEMETAMASIQRSSASMEAVVKKIESGQGTIGKLAQDETLYNNLNQASANLNQTITETRKVTDEARTLLIQIQKDPRKFFKFSVF